MLVLLVIVFFVVVAVVLGRWTASHDKSNIQGEQQYRGLELRLIDLEQQVRRLQAAVARLEGRPKAVDTFSAIPLAPEPRMPRGVPVPPPVPAHPLQTTKEAEPCVVQPEQISVHAPELASPQETISASVADEGVGTVGGGEPVPIPSPVRQPIIDWEQFVGAKLFAWLGGLALFFAAVLGLKYSIERDLIPPTLRAASGFALGMGLLAGGVRLKQKQYSVGSQTLSATGVLILYAVTFACRAYYRFEFFGVVPTFLLMTLITFTAFLMAVRLDAPVVAVLGMLGGFLTPILLSSGEDNALSLFGYVALLDLGLLAVVARKRWDRLALLASVGTVVMELIWFVRFFEVGKIFIAQSVLLGFVGLFVAACIRAQRRQALGDSILVAAVIPAMFALAVSFPIVLNSTLGLLPGRAFTIGFGADIALLAMVYCVPWLRVLETVGGTAIFVLLASWSLGQMTDGTMYWAFGLYLLFAILHTAFPLWLRRVQPGLPPASLWSQFIPATTLLLAILPMVREFTVPWLFWMVILVVDVLAIALAWMAGAIMGLVAVLVLTCTATAVWLTGSVAQKVDFSEGIFVVGGFALLFLGAVAFLWRRFLSAEVDEEKRPLLPVYGAATPIPADLRSIIPSMAAVLPFLLLSMVVIRFKPANPSAVFGMGALLVTLVLGLARITRIDALLAVAFASVGLLEFAWLESSLVATQALIPLLWFLGFYAVFSVFPFFFQADYTSRRLPWAVAALSGLVHFGLVHQLVKTAYPNPAMGLLPAAFAVPALAGLYRLVRTLAPDEPKRLETLAWFGGVILFFVTLVFPIQFDKQWITVAWALEGAALCWLFQRLPHPGLRGVGLVLLGISFLRLVVNPEVFQYHPRSGMVILNWFLYAYGTVVACLFMAARLLAPPRDVALGLRMPPILQGMGAVLLFFLLNIEVADAFSSGPRIQFEFSGNFARNMTYTIVWSLFALGLLVVGIRRLQALVRYAGLGLLSVAVLKLFLYDLSNLHQLYRITAFAAVAVIAFIASFLYQRFIATENSTTQPKTNHETH